VTWLLDGAPVATGHNAVIHTIGYANGTHTLTVRGTDGSLTGSASVPITLQ
jgi:hypothetical protein